MSNIFETDSFSKRHIGINEAAEQEMLQLINANSLDELIYQTIPDRIRRKDELNVPEAISEFEYLNLVAEIGKKNKVFRNYIGKGYYGTITPSVILRNIFQNPGWYTQYTPYQAEISQGRLEALLNFQTVVSDLTQLPIANASLLDEGTAAAEAMTMFFGLRNKRTKDHPINEFFVDENVLEQTKDILLTRAKPIGIKIVTGKWSEFGGNEKTFGVLVQYPGSDGQVSDFSAYCDKMRAQDIYTCCATDLLALALLKSPGEMGMDAAVGSAQRLGVPMGYGGPHAAFFATKEEFKRQIPGRIIGLSNDAQGNPALRMALQTREQHIKREKATSNICTAQALLAIMAGMYATYHGAEGFKRISNSIHQKTCLLASGLRKAGYQLKNEQFYDTLALECSNDDITSIRTLAEAKEINFYYTQNEIHISMDETAQKKDVRDVLEIFALHRKTKVDIDSLDHSTCLDNSVLRSTSFLEHAVFNQYHTETKMMRYIKQLESKDLSLMYSMIPLGSCTMKLNAATELLPVSWPEFANIHPFAPADQVKGYDQIINELADYLCEITGFTACSMQPNSGAQGEFAGLLTINAYHEANGQTDRRIALIPSSAHGTNPASAVMAGMDVVVVKCDEKGNIDVADLEEKAEKYKDTLSALLVTYPSTHGVFETGITEICSIIHTHGGLVYMDGANMNAQVGLTSPGIIGADVCHLNLHKTFAIPHGGGGPGVGPICVNDKLAPFLPGHVYRKTGGSKATHAVSAAPFGSASILLISYAYSRMLGRKGLTDASKYAILNANYIKARLEEFYPVLYAGAQGRAAHELIIDLRPYKAVGVSAEDVAKRLMDYSFHAPTLSFPVAGTLMIEPTESESKDELDRFCEAMIEIKREIDELARGEADPNNNVLVNAPHTLKIAVSDEWPYPYSREKALYPVPYLHEINKFWPSVARVDNAAGDRNLICVCPPLETYES
jgi:glycine dehydrogenase